MDWKMTQLNALFRNKLFYIGLVTFGIVLSAGGIVLSRLSASSTSAKPLINALPDATPVDNPVYLAEPQATSKLPKNLPTLPPSNDINILLLGYGGAGHDGGYLTDSITLVNIRTDTKAVNLISIPRDLYVSIPVDWDYSKESKINAAYAIGVSDTSYPNKRPEFRGSKGGGNLAKFVVSQVTGLPINYFVAIDFSKFSQVIDLLGGIDVDVPSTFEDNFYPVKGLENETCGFTAEQITEFHAKYSGFDLEKQFTCRYEKLHFDKGITHMDGATTLKYVRSRHSNQSGGDFSRSQRQHAVLLAIKDKILSLNILDKANPIFQKLTQSVTTDGNITLFEKLLTRLGNPTQYQVNHIYLTDQNVLINAKSSAGAFILIPKIGKNDFSGVQKYIKENTK